MVIPARFACPFMIVSRVYVIYPHFQDGCTGTGTLKCPSASEATLKAMGTMYLHQTTTLYYKESMCA